MVKTVFIVLENKFSNVISFDGEDILNSWREIARIEGTDVKKNFIL